MGIGTIPKKQYVKMEIFNPYKAHFSAEVKCDWNNNTNSFDFQKRIYLSGKTSVVLSVANHYRNCQIWPKLERLF